MKYLCVLLLSFILVGCGDKPAPGRIPPPVTVSTQTLPSALPALTEDEAKRCPALGSVKDASAKTVGLALLTTSKLYADCQASKSKVVERYTQAKDALDRFIANLTEFNKVQP